MSRLSGSGVWASAVPQPHQTMSAGGVGETGRFEVADLVLIATVLHEMPLRHIQESGRASAQPVLPSAAQFTLAWAAVSPVQVMYPSPPGGGTSVTQSFPPGPKYFPHVATGGGGGWMHGSVMDRGIVAFGTDVPSG